MKSKKKLQFLECLGEKRLRDLAAVAETVYNKRETKEKRWKRKEKERQEREDKERDKGMTKFNQNPRKTRGTDGTSSSCRNRK